ncbi:uncharacterized protein MELLADRAFT_85700 [Melampsora larici-populina 98AG31]|uniref:Tyrosinase copper-binding domain-containing protein n=1 Tax=Melampsora larici-populina (strain 98AG31 / pathotype 3-4-7) TaxID=747676 RepID=F4RJH1_MELLP|nr:uncharacterized protein MELLADRAFT_85700 [Melampsora larici-populina 98AG31]EGG07311.1 hypothetical protein MELLADRAFT_85700 [Melampsora larici-populina 98AG31]
MRSDCLTHVLVTYLIFALPHLQSILGQTCASIKRRQEWRTLSRADQISYIDAVKCLMSNPSQLMPLSGLNRVDDFQYVHSTLQDSVHFVAHFLVWHRHFIYLYEEALSHCGYTGALPRWDWTLDAANVTAAPVWSSDREVGFGTNGTGPSTASSNTGLDGGAVVDGAFARLQLNLPFRHLLQRNWNPFLEISSGGSIFASQYFDQRAIRNIQSLTTYHQFAVAVEGQDPDVFENAQPGPHSTIHALIGGDFPSSSTAVNDELTNMDHQYSLFFLHHANIDWLWWKWQQADRSNRLFEYGGNRRRRSSRQDATLSDRIEFLGLSRNPTISSVMDISTFPHCYTYV